MAGDGSQKVWALEEGGKGRNEGRRGRGGGREAKDELERTKNTLHEVMVR